jgi:hypothetical protein
MRASISLSSVVLLQLSSGSVSVSAASSRYNRSHDDMVARRLSARLTSRAATIPSLSQRQLQLQTTETIEEFCADLSPVESFLTDGYTSIFDEDYPPTLVPESGYQCACVGGNVPALKCSLNYTWPVEQEADDEQDYYINTEIANFTVTTYNGVGYYVPTEIRWCDRIDGVQDSEHCETYEYCDHDDDPTTSAQLCSCSTNQGDGCPSCEICDDGATVALNCSNVNDQSPFNYVTTCEADGGNYAGPLLSGYTEKLTDILAGTSLVKERSTGDATTAGTSPASTLMHTTSNVLGVFVTVVVSLMCTFFNPL